MKSNIEWFEPTVKPKSDIYYGVLWYCDKTIHKSVRLFKTYIYNVSDDNFYSEGVLLNKEDIILYGVFKIDKKLFHKLFENDFKNINNG